MDTYTIQHRTQLLTKSNRETLQHVVTISASGFLPGDHTDVAFSQGLIMKVNL